MGDEHDVDVVRLLHAHAANTDAIRMRFDAVIAASRHIARHDRAYGLLCGWISDVLRAKHARQDDLFVGVEENLVLAAAALRAHADGHRAAGRTGGDERREYDGSLVATVAPSRRALITTRLDWLTHAATSQGWTGAGPARAVDVTSTSLGKGLAWTMEAFGPLTEALDELTGMPDLLRADAATWHNMAAELHSMAADLDAHLDRDLSGWRGATAHEHQTMMAHNVKALTGLASISSTFATITEVVGTLVERTRAIIRDLVADLVAATVIGELTAARMPSTAPLFRTTVVTWAGRLLAYTVVLDVTVSHLIGHLNG